MGIDPKGPTTAAKSRLGVSSQISRRISGFLEISTWLTIARGDGQHADGHRDGIPYFATKKNDASVIGRTTQSQTIDSQLDNINEPDWTTTPSETEQNGD